MAKFGMNIMVSVNEAEDVRRYIKYHLSVAIICGITTVWLSITLMVLFLLEEDPWSSWRTIFMFAFASVIILCFAGGSGWHTARWLNNREKLQAEMVKEIMES